MLVRFKSHIENYLGLQFEWLLHILLIRDVSLAACKSVWWLQYMLIPKDPGVHIDFTGWWL